jgi:hypothetical protein
MVQLRTSPVKAGRNRTGTQSQYAEIRMDFLEKSPSKETNSLRVNAVNFYSGSPTSGLIFLEFTRSIVYTV